MHAFAPAQLSFSYGPPDVGSPSFADVAAPRHGNQPVQVGAPPPAVQTRALAPRPFRMQVFSDLHDDVASGAQPVLVEDLDAVVVAGDTCRGPVAGFRILRQIVPEPVPIVVVAGNHEFYRGHFSSTLDDARRAAPAFGIAFLEDDEVVIAGVRFLGAVLWTDYALYGADRAAAAMSSARDGMNDHRLIGWSKAPYRSFRPQDAALVHRASRAFLARSLATPFAGPTVVVTHHAPHPGSIHPRYEGDPLNAAFASDLTQLITTGKPACWVHGHVHSNFDYRIGDTRIVCNPRGYGAENTGFDPRMALEVAR